MNAAYDLVIRNATIIDGSGSDGFEGDVAVKEGLIAQVGSNIAGSGREEIDAKGLILTPGFVDIHTHYDGQATWSNRFAPSSLHGVTTVVMGNCGVGFAPCRAADRETLVELMAGVEDIPEVVMTEGLPWNWESFPDYLAALDHPHDIDFCSYLPHSALRVFVMGERAVNREPATQEDIRGMVSLTREAMQAGALGVATSRAMQHRTSRGECIPTVRTEEQELLGIAAAVAEAGGALQINSDFGLYEGVAEEFAMFRRLAQATGCTLFYSLTQRHAHPEAWRELLELTRAANEEGLKIRAQVLGRPVGLLQGHELSSNPFSECPAYQPLKILNHEARIAALRTPALRAQLIAELQAQTQLRGRDFSHLFPLGSVPDYEPAEHENVCSRAKAAGHSVEEYVYDLLLENDGRAILMQAALNYADASLDAAHEMLIHPHTLLGLGDGGAHLGMICDASYPTTMIAHWARDRTRGEKLTLPWVIKALTADSADAVGLRDRGRIARGYRADINVLDFGGLCLDAPHVAYDLPQGGKRILQNARGYRATIVNGVVTYRDGHATGALAGRLVRGVRAAV